MHSIPTSTDDSTEIEDFLKSSGEYGIYSTHSETHRPIHVPLFERFPINVPHPVPFAVPQYVRVPIPQPHTKYNHVQHTIKTPVYRAIPKIIEKPVPYVDVQPKPGRSETVKTFYENFTIQSISVEVEKPFPVEGIKKPKTPTAKSNPAHVVYSKHVSNHNGKFRATGLNHPTLKTKRQQTELDFSSIFSSLKFPNPIDLFMSSKRSAVAKKSTKFDDDEYKNLRYEVPPSPTPAKKKYSSSKYGGEFSPREHHEFTKHQRNFA